MRIGIKPMFAFGFIYSSVETQNPVVNDLYIRAIREILCLPENSRYGYYLEKEVDHGGRDPSYHISMLVVNPEDDRIRKMITPLMSVDYDPNEKAALVYDSLITRENRGGLPKDALDLVLGHFDEYKELLGFPKGTGTGARGGSEAEDDVEEVYDSNWCNTFFVNRGYVDSGELRHLMNDRLRLMSKDRYVLLLRGEVYQ